MANTIPTRKFIQFTYDVTGTVDSGAIGTHVIGQLPAGTVITQAFFDIVTTFTSATDAATIGVGVTGTATLFDTAIAISNGANPWDAAIRVADEPTNQNATCPGPTNIADFHAIGTSTVNVIVTTAVEVVTAGKFILNVEYYTRA